MNLRKAIILILTLIVTCGVLFAASLESEGNNAAAEGDTSFNAGEFKQAAEKYELALAKYIEASKETGEAAMKDKFVNMNKNLYASYMKAGDFENAVRIKKAQYKLDKKIKHYDQAALIYVKKMQSYPKAIEVLKERIKIKESAKTYSKIGSYYMKDKDLESAVIYYEKSFAMKPSSKTIKNIAYLYKNLGENTKAINAYERYLGTNPDAKNKATTYRNMGKLYSDINNQTKSNQSYEKSIQLAYDGKIALLLLTNYYEAKDLTNATKKVNQLIGKNANDKNAIYYRARIAYDQNKKSAALADFKKITTHRDYGKIAKDYIKSIESE
jgi:tetratricopeptide (TPR) repeat protein